MTKDFKKISTFTVPAEIGERRLDYIISLFMNLPRKRSRLIVEQGLVLLNGKRVTYPSRKVVKDDRIVIIDATLETKVLKEPEIIYEDAHLIVVNKPAGFLTERIESEKGNTIVDFFVNSGIKVYPVHRLDRETSGVLILAKTLSFCDYLINEFKMHRVNKTYIGIVEGIIKNQKGILKGKIGKHGKYAETHYQVIKILKSATLVKMMPVTGRTHQLRIQFSQIGHSIVGDKRYYNPKGKAILFNRQALHCYKISFLYPKEKKWRTFSAPIPYDMKKLIESLSD